MIVVEDWHAACARALADGFIVLDLLTGIDRGDAVEVVARFVDPGTAGECILSTLVGPDGIPSICDIHPGAGWHEREPAEMFGVTFSGSPDPRPLLLRSMPEIPPLRKAAVLRTEPA